MDFEIVSREECEVGFSEMNLFSSSLWKVSGDREEMYSKLEHDLISQVKKKIDYRHIVGWFQH